MKVAWKKYFIYHLSTMPHELFLRKHTKGNKGGKKMVRDPYEDFGQVYDKEFEERMKRK